MKNIFKDHSEQVASLVRTVAFFALLLGYAGVFTSDHYSILIVVLMLGAAVVSLMSMVQSGREYLKERKARPYLISAGDVEDLLRYYRPDGQTNICLWGIEIVHFNESSKGKILGTTERTVVVTVQEGALVVDVSRPKEWQENHYLEAGDSLLIPSNVLFRTRGLRQQLLPLGSCKTSTF